MGFYCEFTFNYNCNLNYNFHFPFSSGGQQPGFLLRKAGDAPPHAPSSFPDQFIHWLKIVVSNDHRINLYKYSILWTALFGVFGKLFIHINPHGNGPFQRMKNAVWIDLINMLLWLLTTLLSVVLFLKYRGSRSLHTGRAKV